MPENSNETGGGAPERGRGTGGRGAGGRQQPGTPPRRRPFSLLPLLLLALVMIALQFNFLGRSDTITYSEFKRLVQAGDVENLVVQTSTIAGGMNRAGADSVLGRARVDSLAAGDTARVLPFVTTRVDDPNLVEDLQAANIRYEGRASSNWLPLLIYLGLPIFFLLLMWGFMARRFSPQQGLLSIGKSRAKIYSQESTGVTFDDVADIQEAKAELVEVVDFLKNPERYRRLGGRIPKGVLLVGSPGTGKTLLARAVAGEAGVRFFSLTGSDFVEMFVGVGAARVRDLFVQASQVAPSIIFIDELDAMGRMRVAGQVMGGNEEREQTLNQLLAEMDGFDPQTGLIIMAATNRPEILDPALLRPGRFDRKVVLDRPDIRGREAILKLHAREVTLGPDVDLAAIAGRTPGFVGADLENIVNEAALHAARTGKDAVGMADFDEAIERVTAGLEHRSRVMSAKEKKIVAHHEAGHALIAEMRPNADRVAKISIIPRGVAALGYTRQQPTEERYLLTKAELLDRLDVMLGGRVAEELVFNDSSTGAMDDLQHATDLARDMVARFGMSDAVGLATVERPRNAAFLDVPMARNREFSEATAEAIDRAVRELLDQAHERVRQSLAGRREVLEQLARLLMEREVVDRDMLVELLAKSAPRKASDPPVHA
jgi:cell division protease FtsH